MEQHKLEDCIRQLTFPTNAPKAENDAMSRLWLELSKNWHVHQAHGLVPKVEPLPRQTDIDLTSTTDTAELWENLERSVTKLSDQIIQFSVRSRMHTQDADIESNNSTVITENTSADGESVHLTIPNVIVSPAAGPGPQIFRLDEDNSDTKSVVSCVSRTSFEKAFSKAKQLADIYGNTDHRQRLEAIRAQEVAATSSSSTAAPSDPRTPDRCMY